MIPTDELVAVSGVYSACESYWIAFKVSKLYSM